MDVPRPDTRRADVDCPDLVPLRLRDQPQGEPRCVKLIKPATDPKHALQINQDTFQTLDRMQERRWHGTHPLACYTHK